MSDIVLETQDICFDYPGGVPALKGLNLRVAKGRRLAILGPNGAGKTTLLLHLNGTLKPKSGVVQLHGDAVGYSRTALRKWRSTVGLVLQEADDQLFSASVRQDISFGPLNLGIPEDEVRARVEHAVTALRLDHITDRPTHMLSFGQKKRVAIAGVVAMRPEIIILDEPTAGLDPSGERHLLRALNDLHASGTTLAFSTHNIDFAWSWADDVALFKDGCVLCQGPAEDILTDADTLRAIGLRPPILVDIAKKLPHYTLDRPLPRHRHELIALMEAHSSV